MAIDVPRDREGMFEPRFIAKHERRFTGFDDTILALYARGMTVREIQEFLAEMDAVEVSPDLISTVTDAVVAEVTAWQTRPLEPRYPVVFFDALRVKIRDDATVRRSGARSTRIALQHRKRKMNPLMDTAVSVDAQNAPTETTRLIVILKNEDGKPPHTQEFRHFRGRQSVANDS